MEDLGREFEVQASKQRKTPEKPPQRPAKTPLDVDTQLMPQEKAQQQQQPTQTGTKNLDRRRAHENTEEKNSPVDAGDAAIDGSSKMSKGGKNRSFKSKDDMYVMRKTRGLSQQEERSLRREMESLRRQLRDANSRADQAERAADTIESRLKAAFERADLGSDSLEGIVEQLRGENKDLKAELDEARSHIFSLQPYRRDLTPEEVGRDFDDLFNDVSEWVTKIADPILDDDAKLDEVISLARKKPSYTLKLRKMMHCHGDLANGSMFPETDVDLLIAVVMRFLHENIFQKILYGTETALVQVLSFIEGSMTTNVEPKRDLVALRTWRAEAYNAIICAPDFQRTRHARTQELTLELVSSLQLFHRNKDIVNFSAGVQGMIIRPAVALAEKLLTSTHHFYFDLNPYIVWNHRQELEMSPDFLDSLDKMKCENILQNRKPLQLSKLGTPPTREDLLRDLINVTTIAPGLYLRQVGKGDAIKEPTVVRKQHVLVAWGHQEKREAFMTNGERTLMNRIYYTQRDRSEKNVESSWAQLKSIAWA